MSEQANLSTGQPAQAPDKLSAPSADKFVSFDEWLNRLRAYVKAKQEAR